MSVTDAAASNDVSASEIAMLMSVAIASLLFTFVAQQRIDPVIARRLFIMVNAFSSMILAFQVSWVRTLRYVGAVVGTLLMHSFTVAFIDQPLKKTQ